jgi:hypothetical protein
MSEAEGSLSGSSSNGRSNGYSSHDESSASGSVTNSSTTGSTSTGLKSRTPEEDAIARKESRQVAYSKMLVLAVLLASATVAGVVTWIFSTRSEQTDFETQVSSRKRLLLHDEINISRICIIKHILTVLFLGFRLHSLKTLLLRFRMCRSTTRKTSTGSLQVTVPRSLPLL